MGWIVMGEQKRAKTDGFFAPFSYGRDDEIAHDMLLMRGRATLFVDESDAWKAIESTLKRATADGCEWPNRYLYAVIEVLPN